MDSKTNIKDHIKKISKSLFNRHEGRFVKAAAAALLITTLTYNLAFAKEEETPNLNQIYHVYVGNEYMGAVESEETIANLISQKQEEASIQFKGLSIDAGANIKVVPELAYRTVANSEETLSKVNDSIVLEAEAYKVTVNGETVAYLKNESEYEEVIKQLKLQYVSEEQLNDWNTQRSSEQLLPLQLNETRIVDIYMKEDVKGEATKALPSEVLTMEQVVELLKTGSVQNETYTVQQGDVLGAIAKKHNLKIADLLNLNPGLEESTLLKIGQQLNVTSLKPYVSVAVVYENLKEEVIPYTTVTKDDDTILKGETKEVQAGVNGSKQAQYRSVYVNGQPTEITTVAEKVTVAATDKIVHNGTKVIPSRGTGRFVWPTNGGYISSGMGNRWGSYHRGIDIARPSNYTIKAADNGTVSFAGWDGSYGRKIVINHNNGFQTVYAHLSSINVQVGQVVQAGSAIGVMGSTGHSTGIHLHFEVISNGGNVNPLAYLQ